MIEEAITETAGMSPTIGALAAALSKAQGKMTHALREANNPFFRSKYADLASVVEACRPALVANGLSVVQYTQGKMLFTMLLHESGEWVRGCIELKPMRQQKDSGWVAAEDPQSYGSCLSYARRYALAAITGVATDDDDGSAASGKKGPEDAKEPVTIDPAILSALEAAPTPEEWKKAWNSIPAGARHGYTEAKDAAKARFAGKAA